MTVGMAVSVGVGLGGMGVSVGTGWVEVGGMAMVGVGSGVASDMHPPSVNARMSRQGRAMWIVFIFSRSSWIDWPAASG